MSNGAQLADLISVPMEELLVAVGAGIGRAQAEMSRHSIQTQLEIDEDPVLAQYGLQATWYQIPTTELELRVAVAMESTRGTAGTPAESLVGGIRRPLLPSPILQPVNARYRNLFSYDVDASSVLKLTFAAVPPPGPAAAVRPAMTAEEALERARKHLVPTDDVSVPPAHRVSVNFNPGVGAWFVLQTRETKEGVVQLVALVKIDDQSGDVLRQEKGPGA
jgi:hypothetical protein